MRLRTFAILAAAIAAVALVAAACGDDGNAAPAPAPGGGAAAGPASGLALQTVINGQTQGIAVSGQGIITADPDTAFLSLGVSVLADTARGARDQAAEAMSDLLDSVKGNGVDPKDIKTTQFSINPEYDYSQSGEPRLRGYRVTNTVSVKVRDLDRVAEVIDDAVDVVGDPISIGGISFTVDDPTPFLSQARAEAMAEAQAKAQELADLAGVTLGKPISISESSSGGIPPIFYEARALQATGVATPIEPGQLEITVSVQVVYAIL